MSLIAPEKPLGFRNAARIERKAQQIVDPVQRLKYLRLATAPTPPARLHWGPLPSFCMVAMLLSMRSDAHLRRQPDSRPAANTLRAVRGEIPNVWKIEETKDYEVYSNGLRIENRLAIANDPRSYQLESVKDWAVGQTPRSARPPQSDTQKPAGASAADQRVRPTSLPRTQPAGIVFHTTESDQAPFEPTQQHNLRRIGRETLLFVRNNRAY